MLHKYVYLFELDSVRDTDEEIIAGQKAIYREIVENGNIVVMTFNQLVDSRGFFSLFNNNKYRENLLRLFKEGHICISQYGDTRTIVQYLLNSIDASKQFIYSALPLKFTQRRLTALLRRSLSYSDLSEIHAYLNGSFCDDNSLNELFEEVHDGVVRESPLSKTQMKEILTNLYHLISFILSLSPNPQIYVFPKNPEELSGFHFRNYLNAAMLLSYPEDPLWHKAVRCIQESIPLSCNNRSVCLRHLKHAYEARKKSDPAAAQADLLCFCYAEAILNLCYNYTCEMSICNTSKHYCINEILQPENGMPTFKEDFRLRLKEIWQNGNNASLRFLKEETNEFVEFRSMDRIPNFERAIRLLSYEGKSRKGKSWEGSDKIPRYEYQQEQQEKKQKQRILASVGKGILLSIVCILLACLVELAMTAAQHLFDTQWDTSSVSFQIWDTLLFLYLSEAITTLLHKKLKWLLPLSDGLRSLGKLLADGWVAFSRIIQEPEKSRCMKVDELEPAAISYPIHYVRTAAMTSYMDLKSNPAYASSFAASSIYPIADMRKVSVLQQMTRQEEMFGVHYGLVYRSIYNTVLVDPILDHNGVPFPYERILPYGEGVGVVIVPEINGKFILLTQYRHALRSVQSGFPRGFSNKGEIPAESALRELSEELSGVSSSPPKLLGYITPDSGLSAERAAVFLVSLSAWSLHTGHEGILSAEKLSLQELESYIKDGRIEDGFTLGAIALLNAANVESTHS